MQEKDNYLKQELFEMAREDQSLFEFITNFALNGLWFWDLEKPENEYFNDQFWLTLGYDPAEMPHTSSSWQGIIDPEDAEKAKQLVDEHIQDPSRPYQQLIRYDHKSGRDVWIRCLGKVIYKDGRPARMLGVHIDVSDEIRAVADLKNYFKELKDLVLIADNEGRVTSANSLWENYLKNGTDLAGADFFGLVKELGLSAEQDLQSRLQFEGRLSWQTGLVKDREGQAHYFEVSLVFAENRYFLIAREVSERQAMMTIVERKQALLDLLLKFSSQFIDGPLESIKDLIQNSLEQIGQFVNADRAYLFKYDFKSNTTSNTHEWCAEGIEAQIDNLQQIPMEAFPDWLEHHLKGEAMIIPRVDELEPSSLKEILSGQEIKSLVAVPVMVNTSCKGFVGFDWVNDKVEASYEELQVLEVLANMLSHVGLRQEQDTQLLLEHTINKNIIEHIAYPLVVIDTDTQEHVLVNHAFESLVGYDLDELISVSEPYPYWLIGRDAELEKLIQIYRGKEDNADVELVSRGGKILPVRIHHHPVSSGQVKTPLIILGLEDLSEKKAFIDLIEKEKTFNQELLEKSPLYFISIDPDFKLLNLNKAAQEVLQTLEIGIDQGKDFLHYLLSNSKEPITEKEISKALKSKAGQIIKIICRIPQVNSGFIEWSLSLSPHEMGADEILIFGQDVTLRENFIRELEESRQQLKEAQKLALVGNFNLDLSRNLLDLSDNTQLLIPRALKPQIGLGLESVLEDTDRKVWKHLWHTELSKKGSLKFGNWFRFGDDRKYLEFRLHARLVDGENIAHIFGTIQDLSELKGKEEELQLTKDRLIYKSNLLNNILKISRLLVNENLNWDEIIRKSFELLIKDIKAEAIFYLKAAELDPDFSFSWKVLFYRGQEISDEQTLEKLGPFKFGHSEASKSLMDALMEKGYLVVHSEEHEVPFTKFKFEHQFRKMTLFPLVNNGEIQFIWGFIESEVEPWDQELLETILKLAQDFSRSYGLRQAYLSNQENVKNYELISNATGAAIWQVDLRKNTFTRGSGYQKLLGYPQKTIAYEPEALFKKIIKVDRANFNHIIQDMVNNKLDSWQGTLSIQHAEGHAVSVLGSVASVKDKTGKLQSILGSFSESPDFLKDSSLLEKAASVTRIAAWELDMKGPSLRYTEYLKDLLNLPSDQNIDFINPGILNEIKVWVEDTWLPYPEAVLQELSAHPKGLLRDYHFRFPNGKPDKWLRVKSFPITDSAIEEASYMGVIQDITESVLDKEQIIEASRWLEKAQKVGQLGYFLLEEQEMSWKVSEVLAELLEIEADLEASFIDWSEQLLPKYRAPLLEAIDRAFSSAQPILKRCEVYSFKSRQRLWIEISGEVQMSGVKNHKVMLGTVRNITNTMNNLRRMDEQNKRLREIAWAQSHLVRASLIRMQGLLEEINTGDLSDKERKLFFKHFKDSIGELDDIVKDVIKKAQVLEEDGHFTLGVNGNYGKYRDVEVHLVDDDPVIRILQERVVLKSGMVSQLKAHQSGKDFLEYLEAGFKKDHLILVLLDLNMPDLNGWDVLEHIKALDLEEQIIVVVTTSSTDTADLRSSYKYSSVIEYIEKPLNYSKMTRIMDLAPLKTVLNQNKANT